MIKSIIFLLFILSSIHSNAQLFVGSQYLSALINELSSGTGYTISNVGYTGYSYAKTTFTADVNSMPFTSGILLTTGNIWGNETGGPQGPNNQSNASENNNAGGDARLSALVDGTESFNTAILEFDIVPSNTIFTLRYIFASEEYPEYVGSNYKDVAGIFITGPEYNNVNIARLENGSIISVNTINNGPNGTGPCMNCSSYVYNGTGSNAPYNTSNEYLQYDGITTPLTATAQVEPGTTYHIVIAIADVSDGIFDSGLFIEGGGMQVLSSLEEVLDNQVSLFPNPAQTSVTVSIPNELSIDSYNISDLTGRIVQNGVVEQHTIDIRELSAGNYLLHLVIGGRIVSKKLQVL